MVTPTPTPKEPPPSRTTHQDRVARLRDEPGVWFLLDTYETPAKAESARTSLRQSKTLQAKEWEFSQRGVEVYGRFIGGDAQVVGE